MEIWKNKKAPHKGWDKSKGLKFPIPSIRPGPQSLREYLDQLASVDTESIFFLVFTAEEEQVVLDFLRATIETVDGGDDRTDGTFQEPRMIGLLNYLICGSEAKSYFPEYMFEGAFGNSPRRLAFWFNYHPM